MTALLMYILLWVSDNRSFDTITRTNEQKKVAEIRYNEGQFEAAAAIYYNISYGSLFSKPGARLNLANSYFANNQWEEAGKQYKLLLGVTNNLIAARANNQLGIIAVANQDSSAALDFFKTALELSPNNKDAKGNYIFLKMHYSGNITANSSISKIKSKTNVLKSQAAQIDSIKTLENEVSAERKKENFLNSLKSINMSEDQAKAILDAMKANESQYIYQLRRAQYAGEKDYSKKTEW
tara:strand:- start:1238 stop:1951 length:714 start_codon:yes stop_codon:yes gene_type:complete